MKKFEKIFKGFSLFVVAGFIVWLVVAFFPNIETAEEKKQKLLASGEFTLDVELQKDYMVVRPLEVKENALDAYGLPVKIGRLYLVYFNQRGAVSHNLLLPLREGGLEIETFQQIQYWKENEQLVIEQMTTDKINRIPSSITKAEIFLTGASMVSIFNNGSGVEFKIEKK